MIEFAVEGGPAHGDLQIGRELVPDELGALALVFGAAGADVMPPIIDAAVEDDGVVVDDGGVVVNRPMEFGVTVIVFELNTEGMLGIFAGLAAGSALNLNAGIHRQTA